MRFVDRLRIRQLIALIVLLPMLVGTISAGLLAANENQTRVEALQEVEDLEVLLIVRGMESALAAESAFYEGWFSFAAGTDVGGTSFTPAIRASISANVAELGDASIAAIDGAPFTQDQRRQIDDLIRGWYAMREAFDADDAARVAEEASQLGDSVAKLEAMADDAVARQGSRWLPIDRQSRFGVTFAEEMSFIGVLLTSGRSTEADRRRAAVLSDRTTSAFAAMMAVSTPEHREQLEPVGTSQRIVDLRLQAQLPTPSASFSEVVASLIQLPTVTDVVNDIRRESAEEIRLAAGVKADAATTRRNVALLWAAAVFFGPLLLVVVGGGRLSRRLESLADAARLVSNGEMDVRIDDVSGRDEVAEVATAFNQVAEIVARSHDQISALAEGRIDDPSLDDELPGVLGQTLRLALRRLSNATAELAHQANHDKLTGLLDRRGLQSGVDSFDCQDGESQTERGMILVDLDDFKQVNDVHGHAAGDAVLKAIANRLVSGTRDDDLVARLGGDEFLVLTARFDTCEATAQRLSDQIAAPIEWSGIMIPMTASIGFTMVGIDEHFEDVLHRADKALYTAKRSGKNRLLAG